MKNLFKILLALTLTSSTLALGLSNEIKEKFDLGYQYFKQDRFANSESQFQELLEQLKEQNLTDQPVYYYMIEYLALSKSEQGKTDGVSSLFEERLEISKKQFGEESYTTANNHMSLAESYYRDGKQQQALDELDIAERLYNSQSSKDQNRLNYLKKNRQEYTQPFDGKKLPYDLSGFYTACDSIQLDEEYSSAKLKMNEFVEVGVDYKPEGMWAEIFSSAKLLSVKEPSEYDKRVVFIPEAIDSVKDEWCVIYKKSEKVVSVIAHEG